VQAFGGIDVLVNGINLPNLLHEATEGEIDSTLDAHAKGWIHGYHAAIPCHDGGGRRLDLELGGHRAMA